MSSNIAILLNPAAGRGEAKRKRQLLENSLKYYGLEYNIFESRNPNHLARLTAEKSKVYEVIVGAGGDGTFDIIINELIKQGNGNIFGMIGLGSQNDIVREFGVDSLEKACLAVKKRETTQVDLGILTADNLGPVYFLGTASLGLGVTVNKYVENLAKKHPHLTRLEFLNPILGLLGIYYSFSANKVPIPLMLKYEGTLPISDNFSLIVFNNTSFYAGGKRLGISASPYDGLLDCCYITSESFSRFLKVYFLYLQGKHTQEKDVKLIRKSEFKIIPKEGIEIQTDGEIRGTYKQINLSVQPRAMKVIVHPNYVAAK